MLPLLQAENEILHHIVVTVFFFLFSCNVAQLPKTCCMQDISHVQTTLIYQIWLSDSVNSINQVKYDLFKPDLGPFRMGFKTDTDVIFRNATTVCTVIKSQWNTLRFLCHWRMTLLIIVNRRCHILVKTSPRRPETWWWWNDDEICFTEATPKRQCWNTHSASIILLPVIKNSSQ